MVLAYVQYAYRFLLNITIYVSFECKYKPMNYPCGLEPSQSRHNDAIIMGVVYHGANNALRAPPSRRSIMPKVRQAPIPLSLLHSMSLSCGGLGMQK